MKKPNLTIIDNFIQYPNKLLSHIKSSVLWDSRIKARKTASFGVAYNYAPLSYPATNMPDYLQEICFAIQDKLNFLPNNCLMNYYEDGNASMGFHSDNTEILAPNTGVAIVSLGSERTIIYKNKQDKTHEIIYALKPGSLLYMDADIQHTWLHAIPKQENAQERISLTFRQII